MLDLKSPKFKYCYTLAKRRVATISLFDKTDDSPYYYYWWKKIHCKHAQFPAIAIKAPWGIEHSYYNSHWIYDLASNLWLVNSLPAQDFHGIVLAPYYQPFPIFFSVKPKKEELKLRFQLERIKTN